MKRKKTNPGKAGAGRTKKGMALASFFGRDGDVLVLDILGEPRAARDAVVGVAGDRLLVSVTAVPTRGRATDHMVLFLAREFGVTPEAIEVVYGRFHVEKQLRIRSPKRFPEVVARHVSPAW